MSTFPLPYDLFRHLNGLMTEMVDLLGVSLSAGGVVAEESCFKESGLVSS